MRDEGDPRYVRLDFADRHGILASVRAPRKMLAPYARNLLDAAIRNP